MITKQGESIVKSDPHRHKFNDALTEYVYGQMDGWSDNSSGDAECPAGWYAKVGGRRLIRGDERGFVWMETFGNESDRDCIYQALDGAYWAWSADEWDEDFLDDEEVIQARLDERLLYLAYLYKIEGLGATGLPTFEEWKETT